jgi:NAD(P)-dependent dehydrogenase (short-subunit alcohol dehydrogenase family)
MQKVALVTGAAKRIGREIAMTLAKDGNYNIIVHVNSSLAEAKSVVAEIEKLGLGNSASILQADLTSVKEVHKLIDDIKGHELVLKRGGLDALILNASQYENDSTTLSKMTKHSKEMDGLLLQRMLSVHVNSSQSLCLGLLDELKASGKGSVTAITDVSFGQSWNQLSSYSTSKAALQQLMINYAGDFAPYIRFNCIAPGPILEPEEVDEDFQSLIKKVPMLRAGEPHEIAHAVKFIMENNYINGTTLVVDGGLSIRA